MTNSQLAIVARGVGVRFRPTIDRKPTLRRSIGSLRHKEREVVVALDDVDVEVRKGEAFGVIGRNGAGKSTLLRVFAKTLKPDEGTINVYGKTSTLLSLGVGFNPQLSGRRNVLLGGLAAGLTKAEIDAKFDDIVDYAEIRSAIDRPVKTYSSGMFARLAFSVGMALDPNILLLDEVLAVGDEQFQKKSKAAMRELLDRAGTIVFVSHSLAGVAEFCDRAMWMDSGHPVIVGEATEVVEQYKHWVRAGSRSQDLDAIRAGTLPAVAAQMPIADTSTPPAPVQPWAGYEHSGFSHLLVKDPAVTIESGQFLRTIDPSERYEVKETGGRPPQPPLADPATIKVFHGVNKSASGSFSLTIEEGLRHAGEERRIINRFSLFNKYSLDELLDMLNAEGSTAEFLADHGSYGTAKRLNRPVTYLTVIREPVIRAVSVYSWLAKHSPKMIGDRDLVKWGSDAHKTFGTAIQFLAPDPKHRREVANTHTAAEIVDRATKVLETEFSLVAPSDLLDEALFVTAHEMQIPSLTPWKRDDRQPDRPPLADLDPGAVDALSEILSAEIDFYNLHRARFLSLWEGYRFGTEFEQYHQRARQEHRT